MRLRRFGSVFPRGLGVLLKGCICLLLGVYGLACGQRPVEGTVAEHSEPRIEIDAEGSEPFSPDPEIEYVVKQYCRLARDGKYKELRNLIAERAPRSGGRQSKKDVEVPDSSWLDERELEQISNVIPRLIFQGKLEISALAIIEKKDDVAKVKLGLTSTSDHEIQTNLTFTVRRVVKKWVVRRVVFVDFDHVIDDIDETVNV